MTKKSISKFDSPSKRQAEILEFINEFQNFNDYSPSLSEIAAHFKISIPTVHQHVGYLSSKNLIARKKGKKRSIQLVRNSKNGLIEIPLLGRIAAGGPIEAIGTAETIDVPNNLLSRGGHYFALQVKGTSMIEEGICDGDIVIVKEQKTINNGEKAVVYLPEKNLVTLKKVYIEGTRIKLVPANKCMEPFYEINVEIQGKIIGVLRKEV